MVASLFILTVGALGIGFGLMRHPLDGFRQTFNDTLFREGQGSSNVVLVTIGEDELSQYGRLDSWPRSRHAEAIRRLSEGGARVIVYDFLFVDEGPDDEVLAAALSEAGNVVLAVAGQPSSVSEGRTRFALTLPAPTLRDSALALAHSHAEVDGDGRVRRVSLRVESEDGVAYPPLSLAAFYIQFGRDPVAAPVDADELELFGRTMPVEAEDTMRVNYVGGADRFTRIPFNSVLEDSFDPAMVRGKIVLVGVTATGIDRHSAPLLGNAAGIEIHANALDTMLRARFLRPVSVWYVVVVGIALSAIPALTVPRWHIGLATLAAALAGGVYLVGSVVAFYEGYLLDPIHPLAALLLALMAGLVHRVMSERASQREVVDLFGRHVSKEVVRELVARSDRGDLHLGGELREVTVLFCDVRGYTTISQEIDPAELVRLLNVCFEAIVSSVVEQGGIVNKFVGDAVMAFWNAPQDLPDHAYLACKAAGDAIEKLAAATLDGPELRWGFGINTGPAIAGNVGSSRRFEYTLMGEAVNTASRLSGVAGGGEAWLGERTHQLVADRFQCDELPPQTLKGMAAPVAAYRLGSPVSAAPKPQRLTPAEVAR